ncbi:DNA primase small subunit PriS, partial [Candidatus Bathyarchaeota archaeon]|nr:DNA primase small subunit PriS [Candidatus Bathyarchaeota archaeon]
MNYVIGSDTPSPIIASKLKAFSGQERSNMGEQDFIQEMFAEYYKTHCGEIKPPSSLSRREFGFISAREKMMFRHKSFSTSEELQDFILANCPADVYYSSAYYEHPTEPMEKKQWLGADLVFDIDSDHLDTPCKREHDFWICDTCSNSGRGDKPIVCPSCGGTKFKMEAWLCEKCLDAVKSETQKLLDFLNSDFGFPPEDTMTCFSGQRGYHVHIEENEVRSLDQEGRKEIADYITGTGLKLESHGFQAVSGLRKGPDLDDYGWDGRVARGVYDVLSSSSLEDFQKVYGASKGVAKTSSIDRNRILESWGKTSPWRISKIPLESWKTIASRSVVKQASLIDTVVTTDIHRLIRLPFTLHGKTGLKSMEVSARKLERFDPLKETIA